MEFQKLEEDIGYSFKDIGLLQTAFTHSSYANEHKNSGVASYERLEFLGDSLLGYTTAELLFKRYPNLPEGRMTRLRSALVCEEALFQVALKLHLGEYLRLSKGMELLDGRNRPSIVSDTVEALIAALYIDGGMEVAQSFIYSFVLNDLPEDNESLGHDFKSILQEELQKLPGRLLKYELVEESGPDHDKLFKVRATVNGEEVSCATGKTKKEAEQECARIALKEKKKFFDDIPLKNQLSTGLLPKDRRK